MQRAAQQADNFWVVKLAQGARSTDVFVSDLMACIVCHRAAPGDRVAQACIRQPVLFQGRKVDLRVRTRLSYVRMVFVSTQACKI